MIEQFLPERDQINPRWFHEWGALMGSPQLGESLSQNDRIWGRVRTRMFETLGIDLNARLPENEIIAATAYATERQKLVRLCGLVVYGRLLCTRVAKSDFETLAKQFSVEELQLAVSMHHLHPQVPPFSTDNSRLNTLINRAGEACLSAWKTTLTDQANMRLLLIEQSDETEELVSQNIGPELASQIVDEVSKAMMREAHSFAA